MVEATALVPPARGENGLCARSAPAHATEFEPLSDEGLARGFNEPGADGQTARDERSVSHARTVFAEVGQLRGDDLSLWELAAQVVERAYDLGDACVVIAE